MSSPGVIRDLILKAKSLRLMLFLIIAVAFCIFSIQHSFALTADPMTLSVGARSIGMGKAYVAVAEDAETLFINPAGIGSVNSFKLGSMYANLLDGLEYTVLSGVYPLDGDSGAIGAGIISQTTSGIYLYDNAGNNLSENGGYGENMFFISHGFDLGKKFTPYPKTLYGGYSLKYFMKDATGPETSGMNGYGFAADLGLLYKPQGFITYGVSLQNILAGSMSYQNGYEEPIGSAGTVGLKIGILGDTLDGRSIYQSDSKLDLAVDYSTAISGKIPATAHVGLEYKPQIGIGLVDNILTLRAGMNQVPSPTGNISCMTMGVGINFQGWDFNYAYSPTIGDLPETATQFFSISYIGVPKAEKPIEEMKPLISMLSPEDKIITKDRTIHVQGTVSDPAKILKVEINDAGVNVSSSGSFEMNVPLSVTGKHLITVRATDLKGQTEEHKIRALRLVKFVDVADNYWASMPVGQLATVGLVEGYPDGTFQPERALSRAELATLLVKAKGEEPPPVTGKVFKDVAASHWASRYIRGAMEMGLVLGYPDKTFKPNNKINRTEGVVVLSRFGELTGQSKLESGPYPDLTARYWASPLIAAAREAGFLDYIGDKDFEPKKELTRAEAVEILSKTSYGSAKLQTLLDWSVGFEPSARGARTVAASPAYYGAPVAAAAAAAPSTQTVKIKQFTDVHDSYWASESIKYLATAGVMGGYPDGSFKPERIVSRAELASILVKAKGLPIPKVYMTSYTDLPRDNWASAYVKAAVDSGYMTGRQGGKFEPAKGATRAETVAAVVKFDDKELPMELRAGPFPDMTAREWSSRYVEAAKQSGMLDYLKGQDFEANKSITRAELAELLAKTTYGQAKIDQIKSAAVYE